MLKQMLRRDQLLQLFLHSHAPFSCDDLFDPARLFSNIN